MGGSNPGPLRSLPRVFVLGLPDPVTEAFEVPKEEYDKFHKVLRLGTGDWIAVLPGDGRLVQCRLSGREAVPVETVVPATESRMRVLLALGLPKPEKLEESVRMATELGVDGFVLFPAERTVVRWDESKVAQKVERLQRIAREAAEVSFRTVLPTFSRKASLAEVLATWPDSWVLSESEAVSTGASERLSRLQTASQVTLVIGPEGGWAPREAALIGERGLTLGPRVLRVDTAVAAACSLVLCRPESQ